MKMESGLNTGVREVMREKCTDINLLLSEIKKLKQSPWYLRGKDESNCLPKIQYIERKEAVGIVEDLCIKEAPIEQVIPLDEIKNLRKEMSTISRVTDGEKNILYTCLAMIDDLIESYEV